MWEVRCMLFKWLNLNRKSFDWSKYMLFLERFPLPKPNIRQNLWVKNGYWLYSVKIMWGPCSVAPVVFNFHFVWSYRTDDVVEGNISSKQGKRKTNLFLKLKIPSINFTKLVNGIIWASVYYDFISLPSNARMSNIWFWWNGPKSYLRSHKVTFVVLWSEKRQVSLIRTPE